MRIFWNFVTLAIVVVIFSRLQAHFEVIVMSVLGFLYVSIKSVDLRNTNNFVDAGFVIDEQLLRIRSLLDDQTIKDREDQLQGLKKLTNHKKNLRNIDILFLAVIWCFCLFQLLARGT